MNILVVNGSPKGRASITLQTVLYLQKCFPQHTFQYLHAGQQIRMLEKDFTPAVQALEKVELILFSYPVYTFLAPSQLHRFLELVKESGISLAGKYATQITTSKHFYDVTAHRYIQENCQDLGMRMIKGFSADMEDLLRSQGQKEAIAFFRYVLWCRKTESFEPPLAPRSLPVHKPVQVPKVMQQEEGTERSRDKKDQKAGSRKAYKVVIVTDAREEDTQLRRMIARFQAVFPYESRIVNIREYPLAGGCLGCFHCAATGKCIYRDGFDEFLRGDIQSADGTVYAFSIQDHSMGAVFKKYDDRQFCNGHRTVTMGSPVGYLVSGNYSEEENLRMILEGRSEVGGNFLAGVATDEHDPDGDIDRLSRTLAYALRHHYAQPKNFYGVGGMKIFRDLIFLMQGMMRADHRFFKENGQYDFPQKQPGTILKMYLVGTLMASPAVQKKIGNQLTEGMLAPYRKILEEDKGDGRKKQK